MLVAGNDLDEPIADEVRGLVDGHIVLDRRLAQRGHFPPIDVVASDVAADARGWSIRATPRPRRGSARGSRSTRSTAI